MSWRAVIRAFSLSLLPHTFRDLRHPLGQGVHEPNKIATNDIRLIALLRNIIHILPIRFALFETSLNFDIYYVGTKLYGTAIYQIFANAHEILIQASVITIIFSAIRGKLIGNEGKSAWRSYMSILDDMPLVLDRENYAV